MEIALSIRGHLKSEKAAWLLGAFMLSGSCAIAYALIGWLGIGIAGLLGMLVATNIALRDGHAVADGGFGSGDVPMYARQLREAQEAQSSPEQKMAAAAERRRRARTLSLVNSVFIAMAVLGFWMFLRHQLELF